MRPSCPSSVPRGNVGKFTRSSWRPDDDPLDVDLRLRGPRGDGASLRDPQGVLPKISFLKVPEPKTAKNRLHIDLQVSGGRHLDADKRTQRIEEFAAVLVEAGASVAYRSMDDGR